MSQPLLASSPRSLRALPAAVGALALAGALLTVPSPAQAAETEVSGIVFDWGVNNESNGGAYFGGCNFLSAGVAGDTGQSRLWSEADGFYSTSEGNTRIVKPGADGTGLQQPTWSTKCRLPDGGSLVQPTSSNARSYTQSRVQIADGQGTLDADADNAEIQWSGSFTVAYYGGMTYWSVTDPKLVVEDGVGTLTALVTGYGADMDDASVWSRLPDQPDLTLATLSDVDVTDTGIVATPDYLGVAVPDDISGRNPYVSDQPWSGAFPSDFLEFQMLTGQSSYWYTTAGTETSIQPRKVPTRFAAVLDAEAPTVTTQPVDQRVAVGATATFAAAGAAEGPVAYQWQSSADGQAWTDIEGATSASYEVTGSAAAVQSYRALISNAIGVSATDPAALTVELPLESVSITGSPKVGSALTAQAQAADGATLTYQWKATGAAIAGATSRTFTPTAAQDGKAVTVAVTAVSDAGEATLESDPVTVGKGALTAGTPTLSGTTTVGKTLTAKPGTWTTGTKLSYQWLRDGKAISGATKSAYKLVAADAGKQISVRVTGKLSGYSDASKSSAKTKAVAKATLKSATPAISGTAKVGQKLTAKPGTWTTGTKLTYQWLRDGKAISGATKSTYTAVAADAGKQISVRVTGKLSGYSDVSKTSSKTKAVAKGTLTAPTPSISGTVKVGSTVSAKVGTWTYGVTRSYQWYANGKPIAGATKWSYKVTSAQAGKKLTVKVTGKKAGYSTVSKTSAGKTVAK
ncbi:HtaA domain-containing protein [Microbacterium marinilacus]|uniref:Ig-like domain-containing protein n=1 Tax=Microbacterium marinilacus TaxID=415209 RepID=A0ABP7BT05_9MICO|nr:HtaA domain-containing protein [Microbacterium marinilacus]MBY0688289.1 HtaA domain-containing protein [Microbacterium marinilacus]